MIRQTIRQSYLRKIGRQTNRSSYIYSPLASSMSQPRDAKLPGYMVLVARDVISTAVIGILLLCIHELANPFIRGFHCDDDTIRYPHKPSTVSSNVCYFVGSGTNIVLILILEYLALINDNNRNRTDQSSLQTNNQFDSRLYVRNVYCRIIVWFFGSISSELLTDIAKVTAGRLRPHFIHVCQPVIREGTVRFEEYCRDERHRYEYVTDYYCSGLDTRDIRLSFLSGHSSYSAYSAAHAVIYVQSRMDVTKFGLIKPALQVLFTSAAFYTGLTRVSDYKHHWQDVLAGLTLGTMVATVVHNYLWPAFSGTYNRFFRNGPVGQRTADNDQMGGEELNRVSY